MTGLGLRVAFITFVLDYASKWLLINVVEMPTRQYIEITPFFNLRMVWNKGVSFGMFSAESDMGRYLLIAFALIVVAFLVYWLMKVNTRLLGWAIGLVIGGAIGNVVDRFIYGAVADFFDFHALGYHFYTFNVADTAISIGVILLILDAFIYGDESQQKA